MSECFKCKGYCCRYVTVDIPIPRDPSDFDEIRWFVLHKNVIVYKPEDEDIWRIEFRTPCEYLDETKYLCKKYNSRPDVCKEYITDECNMHEEMTSAGCDIYLENEEDLKKYLQKHEPKIVLSVFRSTD